MIDQRSLAMAKIIAKRVRENPSLLDVARGTLERWLASCSPNSRSTLLEWKAALEGGGREKDLAFVSAMLRHEYIDAQVVRARLGMIIDRGKGIASRGPLPADPPLRRGH